jgi:hypothetical protein
MRSLLCVCVLAASIGARAEATPIIGGTATTIGQYPTVVGVVFQDSDDISLCTGELIASDWVLTAAHCVDPEAGALGLADQAAVTAGTTVVFDTIDVIGTSGTKIAAAATVMDPDFAIAKLGSHDLGLVKLATPYAAAAPTAVNLDAANAPLGITVTQVGDGATSSGYAGIEYELKNRTVVSCGSVGSAVVSAADDPNLLCFSQADGKGKCEGDSGGPSFALINGVQTIIGTTSFGDGRCTVFGADTRVDAEKAFLLANIPELAAGLCTADSDCAAADQICFRSACVAAPFTPMGLGSDCTADAMCQTNRCSGGADGMRCTVSCVMGSAGTCPADFDCVAPDGSAAPGECWPHEADAASDGGGCDAGGGGASSWLLLLGALGLVFSARPRSRTRHTAIVPRRGGQARAARCLAGCRARPAERRRGDRPATRRAAIAIAAAVADSARCARCARCAR